MMNIVDFVDCVVWNELAKNCRPTPAHIRDKVDSRSAPDCSGFWRSSEIQTRIITAHLLETNTRGKVLFEMPNSRSATGTQEISRLLWKPEFHNRVQNSLKEVHIALYKINFLRKTTFLRIRFNIICLSIGDFQGSLWHSGSSSKTFSLPCIPHSQSFTSLWRRGANCFI
jgi:hypothetical protein